jgi:hypothetical protein
MRLLILLIALLLLAPMGAQAQRCTTQLQSPAAAAVPPTTINPVMLRVLGPPIIPVAATDGRVHLAYAAQVTNLAGGVATLDAIEPVDALRGFAPTGRNEVLAVDGRAITGQVRLFGVTPPGSRDSATVPAGGSGVMFFDVTYPDLDAVPELLAHRVSIRMADGTTISTLTDPVRVACEPPVRISPPLAGSGWWNANGCCRTVNAHRGATLPLNGDLRVPEQFAIDFVQLAPDGTCCSGSPVREVRSWRFYDAPVLAVGTGPVVEVVDDMGDQVPGPPEGVTVQNAPGNYVIQDIGGGRFVLYAHLRPRSVAVRAGETLRPGQPIGRVGNSGSSTAPHLHFQVMDRPSALNAVGLPFVFDRLRVEGVVQGRLDKTEEDYEAGRPVRVERRGAGLRTDQMPAEGHVFGFHLD